MKIARLKINNFRGIKECEILFSSHTVLVGDNNSGKSTLLEAVDLVLGPERMARYPVIDEHDFYAGEYIKNKDELVEINVEVVIICLSEEQQRHFRNHIEWWNTDNNILIEGPPPENTDEEEVIAVLRLGFTGNYDKDEDNFIGKTFFLSPQKDDGSYDTFVTRDKRFCGFLFLRTLRTGSRALSLERGSLLDIILRLKELRLHMWEDVLSQLRELNVAENEELEINSVLTSIQDAIRSLVPAEWAENPHMRVSDLTREHLRKVITFFMGTGAFKEDQSEYSAPFQHQGTGTINTLVLALLSMIADLKQNVIFAMEEPEIAIPPHTQKRIINSVTSKSAQAIFTSHSPFVLEEFNPSQILVVQREGGILTGIPAEYPPTVKPKKFRDEFRRRFCEALLARRVLITEGRTEFDAIPAAARRLYELYPDEHKTLEGLGIAIINAETETQIAPLGEYFSNLGKKTFAVFDKQNEEKLEEIEMSVDHAYEGDEKGFENIILNGTEETILKEYALSIVENGDWPTHLSNSIPEENMTIDEIKASLKKYLRRTKGSGAAADILGLCDYHEMPIFITSTIESIQNIVEGEYNFEDEEFEERNGE